MSLRNPWHLAGAGLLQELQQSSQLNRHKCLCMDLYLTLTPAALLLLQELTVAFLNSKRLSCVAVYSQNQFVQLAKMSYRGPYICPPPPLLHKLRQEASREECRCTKLCSSGPISRAKKQQTMKIYRNITETITSHCWRIYQATLFHFSATDQKSDKRFGKKPISIEIPDTHLTEVTFGSSSLFCAGPKRCLKSWHFWETTNQQLIISLLPKNVGKNAPALTCMHVCMLADDFTSKELNTARVQKMWLKFVLNFLILWRQGDDGKHVVSEKRTQHK